MKYPVENIAWFVRLRNYLDVSWRYLTRVWTFFWAYMERRQERLRVRV